MKEKLKENLSGIINLLLEIAVGVLLLIDPVAFTSAIIIAIGLALLFYGVAAVLRYFGTDALAAAAGQGLAIGLLTIAAGLFCILRTGWFVQTFPVLTILYGLAVLVAGFIKTQTTVDMLRLKKTGWVWMAVSAALSLSLAAVILFNPFDTTVFLWRFTAIVLLAQAVWDLVTLIVAGRRSRTE